MLVLSLIFFIFADNASLIIGSMGIEVSLIPIFYYICSWLSHKMTLINIMNTTLLKALSVGALVALAASCSPAPYGVTPTKAQVEWQKMETNMFVHFGPNTFTSAEWGDGTESEDIFNPSDLDCEQWTATAKAAGFKGVIITAKHHDGFCLWPNPVSGHTVAQSIWKDGQGDVLAELSKACAKDGLKFGVYVSPWDRNDPHYGTPEYNDIFVQTLESVLGGQYGKVYEQWFDGACGEGPNGKRQVYDWPRFNGTVFKNQPHAVIFSDVGPGCRWMGNEEGSNGRTSWSTMNITGYYPGHVPSVDVLNRGDKNGDAWVGPETDVSIRPGWFWKERENSQVKSVQQLLKIYYESVGRNSLLLLNVPADVRGHLHEIDSVRLIEWRAALDEIFAQNLAEGARVSATSARMCHSAAKMVDGEFDSFWAAKDGVCSASIDLQLSGEKTFNRICLQEYIPLGQRVEAFNVEIEDQNGQMVKIAQETTIGYKRIVLLPTVTTSHIRVNIQSALACPTLSEIALYMDNIYVEAPAANPYENGDIMPAGEPYVADLGKLIDREFFKYAPIYRGRAGVVIEYNLYASQDGQNWEKVLGPAMFDNIVNNPIPVAVYFDKPVRARYYKLEPLRCSESTYGVAELR